MKVAHKLIFGLIVTLFGCAALKRVHRLIDQKDDYIWTGTLNERNYLLTIGDTDGIWYTGKIIIDFQDTLFLRGFEKGSNHPTTVRQSTNDSINTKSLGHIFIWTIGYKADTVKINNRSDSIPQLPINLVLIKTRKTNK